MELCINCNIRWECQRVMLGGACTSIRIVLLRENEEGEIPLWLCVVFLIVLKYEGQWTIQFKQ